ncbi:MAG: MaoC family dehydratase N-terminal domain-containing protein [Dehalococcoidia bacterium]|nr:MaoC family dehydratase N-terminal domain-containing protein [Dehalococcoidia bacterium]
MTSEAIKSFIGRTGELKIFEVEKGAIKRYADSVGETNLLYWDDEFAKNSKYGAIIAPPGFFGWPTSWTGAMPFQDEIMVDLMEALAKEGYPRILDGGIDYEFYMPIRAGDTLATISKVAEINEKESKTGKMYLSSIDTTFTNQNGSLVAKARKNFFAR